MARAEASGLILIGWREWLALPDLGIASIKTKIDTGARSSALHVEQISEFERRGERWVRFRLAPGSRRSRLQQVVESPITDERLVTDSGGNRALRPFIRTRVALGPWSWPIEINLTDRRAMLFPMLLGRSAITGRAMVHPGISFSLGRPSIRVESMLAASVVTDGTQVVAQSLKSRRGD